MAWIRRRRTAGGIVYEVTWREAGVQRSERRHERVSAEAILSERREVERSSRGAARADDADALVDRFLAAQETAGKADATRAAYERVLRRWVKANADAPPSKWDRKRVEAHLAAHRWGSAHRRLVCATLRYFARWARESGSYVPDLTAGIALPPKSYKHRRALTPPEVDRLMAAARGRRYAPAVALAAYAGLSVMDVLTLRWDEVDLASGWIARLDGRHKTGQPLRVPIVPQLAEVLRAHKPLHAKGRVCEGLPENAENRAAHRALRRLYRRANLGVPKGEGWHLLRHSFGTLLMRAGVPHRVIGRLLSHAPGSSETAIYQHPDDSDLVAAMDAVKVHLAQAATPP